MSKVALITGGGNCDHSSTASCPHTEILYEAQGLGLTVAKTLARKGQWTFHIVDINSERGERAAADLGNGSKFHRANVCSYKEMGDAFQRTFQDKQRLDLVFNGAGIIDRGSFHARHPLDKLPPELDQSANNINYNATVSTSYLAQHFFRKNPAEVTNMNLVLVASVVGLYSTPKFPLYVGSKRTCSPEVALPLCFIAALSQ